MPLWIYEFTKSAADWNDRNWDRRSRVLSFFLLFFMSLSVPKALTTLRKISEGKLFFIRLGLVWALGLRKKSCRLIIRTGLYSSAYWLDMVFYHQKLYQESLSNTTSSVSWIRTPMDMSNWMGKSPWDLNPTQTTMSNWGKLWVEEEVFLREEQTNLLSSVKQLALKTYIQEALYGLCRLYLVISVYTHIHVYICVCVYMCTYVHMYLQMHIHMQLQLEKSQWIWRSMRRAI